jgi:putative hydrolase of the HAD superfamily
VSENEATPRLQAGRRGLLIDYGGVLTNPLVPVLQRFCRSKGLPENAVMEMVSETSSMSDDVRAYEVGKLTEAVFLPRFAAALGLAPADLDEMFLELQPDELMFRALAEIRKQGVRTCLVSNSWGTAVYPRELFVDAFDGIVISEEVAMRKPEPEIFIHAAELIQVEPRRCVFVDDTHANFAGAAALGITVIHHKRRDLTLCRLEALLGVDLSAFASDKPARVTDEDAREGPACLH